MPWASVVVNLLLGLPALVPLYCVQWLFTEYLPMDCRSTGDPAAGTTNCDYQTLDHGGPVQAILAVTGVVVLGLAFLAYRALPLVPGSRPRSALGAAVLLLVPYGALWVLYATGYGR
ncbi:hypothetical protein OK074_7788 [Actinobacteria bacterium OK074]|nr:hypothetical protein OK074_7788 [Actinobacteria bacterium OK074]